MSTYYLYKLKSDINGYMLDDLFYGTYDKCYEKFLSDTNKKFLSDTNKKLGENAKGNIDMDDFNYLGEDVTDSYELSDDLDDSYVSKYNIDVLLSMKDSALYVEEHTYLHVDDLPNKHSLIMLCYSHKDIEYSEYSAVLIPRGVYLNINIKL